MVSRIETLDSITHRTVFRSLIEAVSLIIILKEVGSECMQIKSLIEFISFILPLCTYFPSLLTYKIHFGFAFGWVGTDRLGGAINHDLMNPELPLLLAEEEAMPIRKISRNIFYF